jgi:hypothetical protein
MRLRKQLSEAAFGEFCPETIDAAKRAGVINALCAKRVIVDTAVTAKADAILIDSRFLVDVVNIG